MHQERMASWWITWEDLNWPDHDNLDKIKARAEGLAKADVTAAMIFGTHFRWDYLPYFTILHDYLATVAEELHKNGEVLNYLAKNCRQSISDEELESSQHQSEKQ